MDRKALTPSLLLHFLPLVVYLVVLVSCKPTHKNDVWSNYDWLPPGAEGSYNPYEIPRTPYGYGNDGRYVAPIGTQGLCGNGAYMGC